jgi:hypothetical protein
MQRRERKSIDEEITVEVENTRRWTARIRELCRGVSSLRFPAEFGSEFPARAPPAVFFGAGWKRYVNITLNHSALNMLHRRL